MKRSISLCSEIVCTLFPRIVSAETIFFESNLMYCDLSSQYIQVRKLFKGVNYSRKYGMLNAHVLFLFESLKHCQQTFENKKFLVS